MSRMPEASCLSPSTLRRPAARSGGSRWLQVVAYGLLVFVTAVLLQPAHAGQVNWSVGLSSPGAVVNVGNQPPIYYGPPQVVYGPPQVVYPPPRVVYAPPPQVVYRPPIVVREWDDDRRPHWRRHHHRHHKHHDWDRDDRRYGGY